ncbi:MAG TPA: DUF3048 domain-containing protein [Bacilli bacterium]|nr:DUF3048 domain-containing protein [Bacilli bacterium]
MKKKYLLVFILLILFIAGCSNDEPEKVSQDLAEKEVEEVVEPEVIEPEFIYPLTGEATDTASLNRIIGVMVNNHPAARPQSGLSQADIVFEILAEGQTTRFLAMFQSEAPELVGPVRSARPYYFNLANDFDALYVYHGAANFIEDMLRAGAADHLNGAYYDNDGHLFKRESFRKAPHNSYLIFDSVTEVAQGKEYEIEAEHRPFTFLTEEEFGELTGEAVSELSLKYGQEDVTYRYDEVNETYSRFNGEEQTIELNDQTPIELSNVFIIETPHQVVDDAGRREVDLVSGGNAYLLQKGLIQRLEWQNIDGYLLPVKDGEVVPFVPGKTWVNVIPTTPGLAGVTETE